MNDQLNQLGTVGAALLRYLQEEQNALVMGSRFGPRVGQIFRDLRYHTFAFTPQSIEDAKSAIALAGAEEQAKPRSRNFGARGGFKFCGHGHGRGGSQVQFSESSNPGFVPKQVAYDKSAQE